MADLGTTNLLPLTLVTTGAICRGCGEFANCTFIRAEEGYDELDGHYCDECLTAALIMLHEANEDPGPDQRHADEQDALLLSLLEFRGGEGISQTEAEALRQWHDELRVALELVELVLAGQQMVSWIAEDGPRFQPRSLR